MFKSYGFAGAAAALLLAAAMPATAQTPITDKWLTVVLPAEPPGVDGCNATRSFEGRIVKQNVVETMIEKDPKDGSLKPRLALSWEQLDPRTWRFKLRQGVKFHDGEPLTAETAIKSMTRSLSPAIYCEVRVKFFTGLQVEFKAIDEYTLQVTTDKPEPIMPTRMTAMALVSPNSPADKHSLEPIGTGPYAFDSWRSGQEIRLKRFDGYWGARPQVEGVRYIWREEPSVRAAMVKIGEADIAPIIAVQDAKEPGMDFSYLNSETTYLRIDTERAPLDDKRVRLALNYAMDRDSMRGSVLSKDVIDATQIVMAAIPGHNHELDKMVRPYDPARAKELLAEAKAAGVPVDKEILMIGRPSGYPNAAEVMEAFMAMYEDIGLNVKLINMEPGQYNEMHNRPHDDNRGPTLLQATHDNNTGDPIFSVPVKYSCTGSQSMLCDKSVDDSIARIAALSGEERVKGWQELFRTLYEDIVPEVWMYHMVGYARVNPRINFVPDVTTNSEIRAQEITFK